MDTRICRECGEEKAITEFNFKNKPRGLRHVYCRACTREQVRRHYEAHQPYYVRKARRRAVRLTREQREWILNYFSLHPCVDCGESDTRCLDFDHVRGAKRCNISALVGRVKWEVIELEIQKCDVRCANCHRKRTSERRSLWRALAAKTRP